MRIIFFSLFSFICFLPVSAQSVDYSDDARLRRVYFLNDKKTTEETLKNYKPEEVAFIDAQNGVMAESSEMVKVLKSYTKDYARRKYWNFLKSVSNDYKNTVNTLEKEESVSYILNDHVIEDNVAAYLARINHNNLENVEIIDQETLKAMYEVEDKQWGVLIATKNPNDNL